MRKRKDKNQESGKESKPLLYSLIIILIMFFMLTVVIFDIFELRVFEVKTRIELQSGADNPLIIKYLEQAALGSNIHEIISEQPEVYFCEYDLNSNGLLDIIIIIRSHSVDSYDGSNIDLLVVLLNTEEDGFVRVSDEKIRFFADTESGGEIYITNTMGAMWYNDIVIKTEEGEYRFMCQFLGWSFSMHSIKYSQYRWQ